MRVIIAGDFCPQYRVKELFAQRNYAFVLGEIQPFLESADYSIVNYECPVCKGGERPIEKCGPNLHSEENGIEAVKWAGFDCVTLANNHFLDYDKDGVKNTIDACKKHRVDYVGGGLDLYEASQILYKKIKGETLAVINCCEHEFSIATNSYAGSNPLNPIQQFYAIKEAHENADHVLVIIHGGNEHYQLPSPRMQEVYRFFIDAGADAVVNHHQHCYSGYEMYNGKPIFYGIGNFCFDSNRPSSEEWFNGYIVELFLSNEGVQFGIVPYKQCRETPFIHLLSNDAFVSSLSEINRVISDKGLLEQKYAEYLDKNSKLNSVFSPFSGRVLSALCRKRLLPSFITKKKKTQLLAYIQCESHYPKVLNYLKK